MKDPLAIILFSGIILFSTSCVAGPQASNSTTGGRVNVENILNAHNQWRRQVGTPDLSWSNDLEQKAIAWAHELETNGCFMKHSGPGENLFWASPRITTTSREGSNDLLREKFLQPVSEQRVVDSWAGEKDWFNPDTNSCNAPYGKTCNHYTQLVWSTTSEVGCGKAVCTDLSQVWVCNYDPPGNMIGRKPY